MSQAMLPPACSTLTFIQANTITKIQTQHCSIIWAACTELFNIVKGFLQTQHQAKFKYLQNNAASTLSHISKQKLKKYQCKKWYSFFHLHHCIININFKCLVYYTSTIPHINRIVQCKILWHGTLHHIYLSSVNYSKDHTAKNLNNPLYKSTYLIEQPEIQI